MKLVATGLALAALYVASQGVNPVAAALAPGDHRIALQHGGRQRSYIVHAPPGSKEAGHTATRYEWAPCREGSEVVLWKFTGAGHVWPGGLQDYLPRLLGPSTALVDANLEMWRFFQRLQLDALSPTR